MKQFSQSITKDQNSLKKRLANFVDFFKNLATHKAPDSKGCAFFVQVQGGEVTIDFVGNVDAGISASSDAFDYLIERLASKNPIAAKNACTMLCTGSINRVSQIVPEESNMALTEILCEVINKIAYTPRTRKNKDAVLCCFPVKKGKGGEGGQYFTFMDGKPAEITEMLLHVLVHNITTTYSGDELEKGCETLEEIASRIRCGSIGWEEST